MFRRLKTWALVAAVVIGGFFEQGCIGDAGSSLAKGGLDGAKAWVQEKIAEAWPSWEAKATAFIEAKLAEKEAKVHADFDAQLLKVAPPDPVTGGKLMKTWKDFDVDKNGHLEATEIAKITAYIFAEGPKRVSDGSMSTDEWTSTQKAAGGTAGSAAAVALGIYALKKRKESRDKKAKEAAAAAPPPPEPAPPVATKAA